MNYNPFVTGKMIQNPVHFVGRIREADDIMAKIRGNNAVSIVGERRIGKSSLLSYLKHACHKQFYDQQAAFLDFTDPQIKTLEGFVQQLLEKVGIACSEDELKKEPNLLLTLKIKAFTQNALPPIVFIDEFDKIQTIKAFFNDDFLSNLRYLGNAGLMCLVTASKMPLKDMIDKGGLTSPLWNIFSQTNLREFVVEEALDERLLFLETYWDNDLLTPTEAEMRFLLSYTSTHPLVMQIVSYNVCQNRYVAVKRTEAQLREKIEADMTSYFRDSKETVRQWLYGSAVKLPQKIEWTSEFIGKNLKHLNPLKDLKIIG